MNNHIFAGLRIRGRLKDYGQWMKLHDVHYIDIEVSKDEAERVIKFLTECLRLHESEQNV